MAENTISAPQFDFGVENSEVLGNLKQAEAFLSETALPEEDPEKLQKITPKEEEEEVEAKEKKPTKKTVEKKPSAMEVAESFLSDKEEEGNEEEEEIPAKVENKEKPESNQFETFSKELYSLNVLSQDDEEEPVLAKSGQELLALLNKEKQKGAIAWLDNFLEQHGEDRRELFEAIFIKGADPKEYLPVYNQVAALEGIDLEQEANQEKVVREFYKRAGIPEEKIPTKIQKLKDIAELENEAKDFHPQLVQQDKERAKKIEEESQARLEQQAVIDTTYKEALVSKLQEKLKQKEFDGIPINQKLVQEAFDALYTKKWKLSDGQLITDFDKLILETKKPENIEKRIKIMLLEKTGWDFSKIEKKAISKKSEELFQSLAHKDAKNKQQKTPDNTGW